MQTGLFKKAETVKSLADRNGVSIDFINKLVAEGMKVESEHSRDTQVQRTIAIQHLSENLGYYKELEKVESNFPPKKMSKRPVYSQPVYAHGGNIMPFESFEGYTKGVNKDDMLFAGVEDELWTKEQFASENFRHSFLKSFFDWNFYYNYIQDDEDKQLYKKLFNEYYEKIVHEPDSFKKLWRNFIKRDRVYPQAYIFKNYHYDDAGKSIEYKNLEDPREQFFYQYKEKLSPSLKADYENYKLRYSGKTIKLEKGGNLAATPAGGAIELIQNGKRVISDDGTQGGIFKGQRHSGANGGIDGIVDGSGQVKVETEEALLTPGAVNQPGTFELDGKQVTAKQAISQINTEAGGVPIKKAGGEVSNEPVGNSQQAGAGNPIKLKGSSVVITRNAVLDDKKREFNGKMLTNRQILSEINVRGGGAAFEDGGALPGEIYCGGAQFSYGGQMMHAPEIAEKMNSDCGCEHSMEGGGKVSAQQNREKVLSELEEVNFKGILGIAFNNKPPENKLQFIQEQATGLSGPNKEAGNIAYDSIVRALNGNEKLVQKCIAIMDDKDKQRVTAYIYANKVTVPAGMHEALNIKPDHFKFEDGGTLLDEGLKLNTKEKMVLTGVYRSEIDGVKGKLEYLGTIRAAEYYSENRMSISFAVQDAKKELEVLKSDITFLHENGYPSIHDKYDAEKFLRNLNDLVKTNVGREMFESKDLYNTYLEVYDKMEDYFTEQYGELNYEKGGKFKLSDLTKDRHALIPVKPKPLVPEVFDKEYPDRPIRISDIPASLRIFMPEMQQKAIVGSQEHWEVIERLNWIVNNMPQTYETEDIPTAEKIVWLHYFYGGSDWFIVEKDMGDKDDKEPGLQYQAFGYTILNGDTEMAEWGYISIEELKTKKMMELDFYFTPVKFADLKNKWEEPEEEEPVRIKARPGTFLYGIGWNEVPEFYSTQLLDILNARGFAILKKNGESVDLMKNGHRFYVNDNGGEFNLGNIETREHISNIPYSITADGDDHYPVDPAELAADIESAFKEYYEDQHAAQAQLPEQETYITPDNPTPEEVAEAPEEFSENKANAQESLMQMFKGKKQSVINDNIRALLKKKGPNRKDYSADELAFIKLYEGAGGLIKEGETGARILDQFFTPVGICAKMWGLAVKNGFEFPRANILEPAVGSGRFLQYIPADQVSNVTAYDVDETCYLLCKVLFPEFDIKHGSFESMFFKGKRHIGLAGVTEFYDLVIGNPPYRDYISEYAPLGEQKATGAFTFEMYFIMRGVDVLKPGGLLVMLIPNSFMSNDNKYNPFKEKLAQKADLVDGYRLPNGVFGNTDVGTDIIVLRKK